MSINFISLAELSSRWNMPVTAIVKAALHRHFDCYLKFSRVMRRSRKKNHLEFTLDGALLKKLAASGFYDAGGNIQDEIIASETQAVIEGNGHELLMHLTPIYLEDLFDTQAIDIEQGSIFVHSEPTTRLRFFVHKSEDSMFPGHPSSRIKAGVDDIVCLSEKILEIESQEGFERWKAEWQDPAPETDIGMPSIGSELSDKDELRYNLIIGHLLAVLSANTKHTQNSLFELFQKELQENLGFGQTTIQSIYSQANKAFKALRESNGKSTS